MFYIEEFCGKKVLKSDVLEGLNHFFTTRDCPVRGAEDLFKESLSVSRFISPIQTHSDNVSVVDSREEYPDTDGLIFNEKSLGVFLCFADCTPLIFYDERKKLAAVSHAGWKGTAAQIGVKTVNKMINTYGSIPSDIKVAVGPAISGCCYEVSEDVLLKLLSTVKDKTGLYAGMKVDLKQVNARQLQEIGIKEIDICPYCTSCNNDLFFSYRKENGTTLRHNAVAWFN